MNNNNNMSVAQKHKKSVAEIRNLIQNLDAELTRLCTQCKAPSKTDSQQQQPLNAVQQATVASRGNSPTFRQRIPNPTQVSTLPPATAFTTITPGMQNRTLSNVYRAKVIEAYRHRRIFTVYQGYQTVRRALFNRGWLEKLPPGRYSKLQCLPEDVLLAHAKHGNEYEAVLISRLINHFPSFFIWQGKGQRDLHADVLPYRNRVRRGRNLDFTTKIGLIGCTEHEQWCNEDGICHMRYPRCYRLGGTFEERLAFIDDFRQTQCRSLIRYLHENIVKAPDLVDEIDGTIEMGCCNFAMENIRKELHDTENRLLDTNTDSEAKTNELWQRFMIDSNAILKHTAKLKCSIRDLMDFDKIASVYLKELYQKHPNLKWDGCRNLWILKPGYSCRGLGISIRSSLDEILHLAANYSNKRYIAQKYIERPLLIYKTKFDIRQYMLLVITETSVNIWMYRDCYFRFSSQEFNMDDLRESIHLTNNCVQRKYRNKTSRDRRLPRNNMWSLEDFKAYLKTYNKADDFWHNHVYRGMKENLIAVVMASMEETDFVQNAFELYGCDFMMDEEFNPILIEINSTPDLAPSTNVTARICPMALRDCIKVVVDLPRNPRTPTGLFEKIFEINYRIKRDFDPKVGLQCAGRAMKLSFPQTTMNSKHHMVQGSHSKFASAVMQATPAAKKSFKVKFFSKSFKMMKCPLKGKKKEMNQDSFASNINVKPPPVIVKNQLKSVTKEALALQYTTPK